MQSICKTSLNNIIDGMFKFFCLSFENEERYANMSSIFNSINVPYQIFDGVNSTDPRMATAEDVRCWSCMYGHLDMIRNFIESSYEYGIFCEDDIMIHKQIGTIIPNIISDFDNLKLDVLLLGYLLPFKLSFSQNIVNTEHIQQLGFTEKQSSSNKLNKMGYTYHEFPDTVWGAQMYMLSKQQAIRLLAKYENGCIDTKKTPFSADWTLTKEGNRAIISPMLACEIGGQCYKDKGQHTFHHNCHIVNKCEYFIS